MALLCWLELLCGVVAGGRECAPHSTSVATCTLCSAFYLMAQEDGTYVEYKRDEVEGE